MHGQKNIKLLLLLLLFCLLNCVTKTIRVAKGRKDFPQEPQATRGPHSGNHGLENGTLTILLPISGSEQLHWTPLNEANATGTDCCYYYEEPISDYDTLQLYYHSGTYTHSITNITSVPAVRTYTSCLRPSPGSTAGLVYPEQELSIAPMSVHTLHSCYRAS